MPFVEPGQETKEITERPGPVPIVTEPELKPIEPVQETVGVQQPVEEKAPLLQELEKIQVKLVDEKVPDLQKKMELIACIIDTMYGNATPTDIMDSVVDAYESHTGEDQILEWARSRFSYGCDECDNHFDWA